jgi:protein SCO1/2
MIALSSSNRAALARLLIAALAIYLLDTIGATAQTVSDSVPILQKVNVVEHLGDTIPLDVAVTNDAGEQVMMGRYFTPGRPVVLILAYYECPMLCNLVMNSLTQTAKQLLWLPGKEYQIVTVSINPAESLSLARGKKDNYIRDFGRPEAAAGWAFCIAAEDQSRKLADAVGFKYYYDEHQKQYAHPAVITILTGSGVISRYLYGIEFKERDLRLALLEASEGKIGTTVDRILLYCYHYDPNAGGYVLMAGTIMRVGGLFTIVLLALFLGLLWRREGWRRRGSRQKPPSNGTTAR